MKFEMYSRLQLYGMFGYRMLFTTLILYYNYWTCHDIHELILKYEYIVTSLHLVFYSSYLVNSESLSSNPSMPEDSISSLDFFGNAFVSFGCLPCLGVGVGFISDLIMPCFFRTTIHLSVKTSSGCVSPDNLQKRYKIWTV